ncbi:unnamed protein product [Arctia plantaginis]|uniref:Integrin beta n=1 Tax=Arctia plantaginis TaxID=874455 RepID=A0A8S1AT98_ARCPL|nr:unnamed protein product [Arctia plantaginis]
MFIYNLILVLIFGFHDVLTLDSCSSNLKCHECIRDPSLCVWCPTNNFNGTRCMSQNLLKNPWCPEMDRLEDPENLVEPLKNLEFSNDPNHTVQIKPQIYKMNLRPGKMTNFTFSIKNAKDFPVDLYFLLDASTTMSSIKEVTANQSEKIYMTMKNLTKNVNLGYGTFVDKCTFPFTRTFNIEETYSFRHRLALTNNFTQFKNTINTTPVGQNRDSPEGGLDALAQVMACPEIIKWRKESRKIIVFLTGGEYHAALDGKQAGIFQPYDGNCYLENGTYTKELEMDYPSVGMINKLAIEGNMIIFFYVHYDVEGIYKKLSNVISGSKIATFVKDATLSSDVSTSVSTSDNFVDTLKEIYEKISNKVILKKYIKTKYRKNIEISLTPNCVSEDSDNECDLEVGKEKQFMGTIKLLKYDEYENMTIDIAVESIGEKLTIDIDVIKDCNCTNSGVANSTYCHGEPRICGECSCGDKRYGDRCVCEKTGGIVFNSSSSCIQQGDNDVCTGHGSCECGACRCRPGYTGKFCQCNDLSCPLGDGKLCSGEKHGKCQCGKCKCEPDWGGDACQCSKHDCVIDGKECSGFGTCVCGVCVCNPIAPWDKRSVRDESCKIIAGSDTLSLQCKALEDCAKCQQKGKNHDCDSCDNAIQTRVVKELTEEYLNSSLWNACPDIKVALGCYSKFIYRYDDIKYSLELVVEQKMNCAETHYLFGGIFSLVVIIVGVLTLVAWKLLTDARDRREYKQFLEKSEHDGNVTDNPLYTPAVSSFQNPGFRKRSYKQ